MALTRDLCYWPSTRKGRLTRTAEEYCFHICLPFKNIHFPDVIMSADGVSNHQPYDCLLSRLFMRRAKETSKLRITGLCVGNSPITGEFPAQRAKNAQKYFHLMSSSYLRTVNWLMKLAAYQRNILMSQTYNDKKITTITSYKNNRSLQSIDHTEHRQNIHAFISTGRNKHESYMIW